MSPPPRFDWPFWLLALALIIGFREGAVWLLAGAVGGQQEGFFCGCCGYSE